MSGPLIAIVGPTATGKSELAIKLAKKYNGEIVSADSWLVRKGVDIGTAKPTLEMRQQAPHHLIDIIEADEDFSAAAYKKLASAAIEDILARRKLPLLVGGTGLYIDSLLYDYSFLATGEPEQRQRLNAMSLAELHQIAKDEELDLSLIDMRNKRRVIRLIETKGGIATKSSLRSDTLIIGLASQATAYRQHIADRVEQMITQGLEKEVKNLSERYGWECEALKGIGYSEWRLYFEGQQSLEITKERIIKDTVALARRQQTWFKRNKSIHWFATPVNITDVDDLMTTFLNKYIFV